MIRLYLPRVIILLLALSIPDVKASELQPFVAQYEIRFGSLNGELTSTLEHRRGRYYATSTLAPVGSARRRLSGEVTDTSEFVVVGNQVLPLRFTSTDELSAGGENTEIVYDWRTDVPFGEGVEPLDNLNVAVEPLVDRLSIQYALMADLLRGRIQHRYRLTGKDGANDLKLRIEGMRELQIPYGTLSAIGISHQGKKSHQVTTVWFAPALNYVPVLLEHMIDGHIHVRAALVRLQSGVRSLSAAAQLNHTDTNLFNTILATKGNENENVKDLDTCSSNHLDIDVNDNHSC